MSFSVGIGIITYNRREIVSETIRRVQALTRQQDAALVVADDGSTDGTPEMLRDRQVPVITGINMGVGWNKNRALFLLRHMLRCETVILLEDDTSPHQAGWEAEWMRAAQLWGHVNFAADWLAEHFLSGAGTADDPVQSQMVTAQCAAFSSAALTYGGYFDTRFKGYGYEHVEHSHRLVRIGFGGTYEQTGDLSHVLYNLVRGDMTVAHCPGDADEAQIRYNREVAAQIMALQGYRAPWGDDSQLRQFRAETESAMRHGPEYFRLTPPASGAPRGVIPHLLQQG